VHLPGGEVGSGGDINIAGCHILLRQVIDSDAVDIRGARRLELEASFILFANTARLPSVTLFDASVRADLGAWSPQLKGAFVQVNASNLGDRDYISGCYGTNNCYVGAERSVLATVGYDF